MPLRAWRGLVTAFTFLTVIPVPAAIVPEQFDLGAALPWFPLIGALVGAIGGGVRIGLTPVLGAGPASALAIAAIVVVTAALHLDGFADCCDGLTARGDRERRLAIMHDSRLGSYGIVAIVCWALTLYATLTALSATHALLALTAAGAGSRFAAVLHGRLAAPARSEGLGAALGVNALRTILAATLAVVIAGAVTRGIVPTVLAVGVAAVIAGMTAAGARSLIGGSSGDTLGGTMVLSELAVCLALLALWH
jgi:adenosylcobinamide-GDP ribazoletransferase